MSTRYRKIPVEVDAFCYNVQTWPAWFHDAVRRGEILAYEEYAIIKTVEGDMRAQPGDWIVMGVEGEFYPVKASIFEATYEHVW